MNRRLLAVSLFAPLLGLAACSTDAPKESGQAGLTTNAVSGTVKTYAEAGLDDTYAAAQKAVKEMQFTPVKEAKDALKGIVNCKTADDKAVGIVLNKVSDSITEVSVNAGTLNTDVAKAMAARIQALAK